MTPPIETRIADIVGLHERGLLTDVELVNDFLLIAAEMADVPRVIALINQLPASLELAVRSRLDDLHRSGFKWRPFMMGEGFDQHQLVQLSAQLRDIHRAVSEA